MSKEWRMSNDERRRRYFVITCFVILSSFVLRHSSFALHEVVMAARSTLYGLLAEFDNPTALVSAARLAFEAGYRKMGAYTPFPVEVLAEASGYRQTRLPMVVLLGGLVGCVGGFFMQWYASVIGYPLNIAGRPLNSWPAFIPITFELTVLCAALAAVLGMLAMNGLPQPYHPLFHHPRFAQATRDRFFLTIQAIDPHFDMEATRQFVVDLGPRDVAEVPR